MSKVLVTDTNLTNIANAIRSKNGTSNTYTPAEMSIAINNIPSESSNITSQTWDIENAFIKFYMKNSARYVDGDYSKSILPAILTGLPVKTAVTNGTTVEVEGSYVTEASCSLPFMMSGGETYNNTITSITDHTTYTTLTVENPVTYAVGDKLRLAIGNYRHLYNNYPEGANLTTVAGEMTTVDGATKTAKTETVSAGNQTIYNLAPGESVYTINNNGIKQAGRLIATGQVRKIRVRHNNAYTLNNVRDLGGWTASGGTVNYGKLYRGDSLTVSSYENPDILANARDIFLNRLGVRAEILLYETTTSEFTLDRWVGVDNTRVPLNRDIEYNISSNVTESWQTILRFIFDNVAHHKPVYFHCLAGLDRTGTTACILLSLLGVSRVDCGRDFELSFSTNRNITLGGWADLMSNFNAKIGATHEEKVINWAIGLGFTIDEINAYRKSMINGTPAKVTSITNTLVGCTSNSSQPAVVQGNPYTATITAQNGYTLTGATVSITMGGTNITSTAYNNGTINIPNVTDDIVINIEAQVESQPVNVSNTLVGCTSSNSATNIPKGASYSATITPEISYSLSTAVVSITMGGADITSTAWNNGTISIASVTGDLSISVTLSQVDIFSLSSTKVYSNMRYRSGLNMVSGTSSCVVGFDVPAKDTVYITINGTHSISDIPGGFIDSTATNDSPVVATESTLGSKSGSGITTYTLSNPNHYTRFGINFKHESTDHIPGSSNTGLSGTLSINVS